MKYIRRFNEESKERSTIEDWCIENLLNYTINDNGTVDVDGGVDIPSVGMLSIPIQFGTIGGYFDCSDNNLTSLRGCPKIVNFNFNCCGNKLTTLEFGPEEVGGGYYCSSNNLISLEGYPEKLGGYLLCGGNPIFQIYNLFGTYKKYKDSLDYNYLRGRNIIELRFKEALEEVGRDVPESIPGYKYI